MRKQMKTVVKLDQLRTECPRLETAAATTFCNIPVNLF